MKQSTKAILLVSLAMVFLSVLSCLYTLCVLGFLPLFVRHLLMNSFCLTISFFLKKKKQPTNKHSVPTHIKEIKYKGTYNQGSLLEQHLNGTECGMKESK